MDDQTTITQKPDAVPITPAPEEKLKPQIQGSHFFSLSTRSLITLIVVVTACIMSFQGKAIEEPLKVLVVSIVSFYFGQNLRPSNQS